MGVRIIWRCFFEIKYVHAKRAEERTLRVFLCPRAVRAAACSAKADGTERCVGRGVKMCIRDRFSDVQRADDIEVVIDGAAGQKQFAYMEPIKLKNPSVTAEGYVINGRAFVDYILHAEDIEKA